jgi:glycosyltransferase involved in cell wall biosynthesis
MNIYIFQWISELGGADTRLKDLLKLFGSVKEFKVTCIPNDDFRFLEKHNIDFLLNNNIDFESFKTLPKKLDGIALSFCNFRLFSEKARIDQIKDSGLKFVWSNDMMWHTNEEIDALKNQMVDAYLYTSEFHKEKMQNELTKNAKEFIVPNYFDSNSYSYHQREPKDIFTIGKHSRPDNLKFSDDFPLFYHNLNLKNPRYRVMGVSDNFKQRFMWYNFDTKWELLKPNQEITSNFLNTLDAYVYNSHPIFIENQSRAIVEAALNGLPIIAPNKYNFPNQIIDKQTGFLWDTYEECVSYAQELEDNPSLRKEMGIKAHNLSKDIWCDKDKQLKYWNNIFSSVIS